MADNPEGDDGLGEIENTEPTDSEYYEVEDGYIIFPQVTDQELEAFTAWYLRIFGSVEAYIASLPSRNWVRGPSGWVSYPND